MWKVVCDWLKSVLLKTKTQHLTHKALQSYNTSGGVFSVFVKKKYLQYLHFLRDINIK